MATLKLSDLQIKVLDKMHRLKCVGYSNPDGDQWHTSRWWYILSYSIDTVNICSTSHQIIENVPLEDLIL